ncbi:MAG: HAD-IA family hydrolase [Ruminobacter sp.]|jgi:phosphoglycolate phosphatase|nr:HAD-IA family hydrolase [Ruminobacter sp.]MBR1925104.1 HAD-IA family hydrolase [Ruminobacter sp.]
MFNDVRAVIFDIDGTLMDSINRIVECIRISCSEVGANVPSGEQSRAVIGLSLGQAIACILPGRDEKDVLKAIEVYKKTYLKLEQDNPTGLFADAYDVLLELKKRGYKIGIATGKSRMGYNRVMSYVEIAPLVDVSSTGDEVRSKPDQQMLNRLSDELRIPPKGCLMVGDSSLDISMGVNAHTRTAGVLTGVHDRNVLMNAGADVVVNSLTELLDYLPGVEDNK